MASSINTLLHQVINLVLGLWVGLNSNDKSEGRACNCSLHVHNFSTCFQNDLLLANYIIVYIITEFTAVATFTYTSTTVPIDAHLPVATCTYKCISATNTISVHVDQPLSCTFVVYSIQWLVYSNYLCQEQTWLCHMTNSWGIVPAYRKKSVVIFKLSSSIYSK